MLPPERELAEKFNVGYGMVRLANEDLIRRGIIARHQGRGSYVTRLLESKGADSSINHRLGLLYVDLFALTQDYNQELTFELQRVAAARGYQLAVEQMHTDDLMLGRTPAMLATKAVDAVILYGAVRDHHVEFLKEKNIPFIVAGNTPIDRSVPQARMDAENIAYDVTAQLIRAGRSPVWFDGEPANSRYHHGIEMITGYIRAQRELSDGSTYFCDLKPDRIMQVAETLCRGGLHNAAYIVSDWSYPLLPMALRMSSKEADRLLILPMPQPIRHGRPLLASNIVTWTRRWSVSDIAEPAVNALVDVVEGLRDEVVSTTVEARCVLSKRGDAMQMQARVVRRQTTAGTPAAQANPPRAANAAHRPAKLQLSRPGAS